MIDLELIRPLVEFLSDKGYSVDEIVNILIEEICNY